MTSPKRLSTREVLEILIGFDTTSRNPNRALIDWIADYLAGYGIESTIETDGSPDKANLLATVGPQDKPGVVLAGHTDVVPVDGQDWDTDPWTLTERDGRLYGRGTSDMKTWSALILARVPEFLANPLQRPVHFGFTYDEETTCLGAVSLAGVMAALPCRPEVCVVGEPSGMRVVTGQKGTFALTINVRGKAAHSSLAPQGVNAVEYACKVVTFCADETRRFAVEGPFVEGYEVPYTTVSTTIIDGGTALNIVPQSCSIEVSVRNLPDHDPDTIKAPLLAFVQDVLEPEMKAIASETGIDVIEWSAFAGYQLDEASREVQFVRSLSGHNEDTKVTYFSEAGIYADGTQIPSMICGPGFIEQAHIPNEFISLDQVAEGERFLDRLMEYLCRPI